ncbi:MAG: hypothetical protein JSV91_15555 [Phycisphaerales bacterium]|nr:MAG: hypothetical protein JSV91_15555 [Phycisphaerales bacterium]
MDRERLKEVHQTDLTESNINEDFVDWLKTKGPSWLLTILICIIAYVVIIRFKQHRVVHETSGWNEFQECRLPGAFEDVANEYGDLEGLSLLARLQAADMRMAIVLRGYELDTGLITGGDEGEGDEPPPEPEPVALTEESRAKKLALADQLYQEVLEYDDQAPARTLFFVNAITGRAAVAEARGELDDARGWWEQAAERVEPYDADLAQQFRRRVETLDAETAMFKLPTEAEIQARQLGRTQPTPLNFEEAFRDLLLESPIDGE